MKYWLDTDYLLQIAQKEHPGFAAADPFPHVVLPNFLSPDLVRRILEAFPATDAPYWYTKNTPDTKKQDTTPDYWAELRMPEGIREAMVQFNSAQFLIFLRTLTGIDGLMPDPWLYGGGIHQILPGGLLKVHADFNIHEYTGLRRRLNVLLYLNEDWQDEWGGHLELWDRQMTRCVRRVAPDAGTCVIFETASDSYHGHPDPLTCPDGVTRKSIALYYYTIHPEFDPRTRRHNTLFKRRPGEDF